MFSKMTELLVGHRSGALTLQPAQISHYVSLRLRRLERPNYGLRQKWRGLQAGLRNTAVARKLQMLE